MFGVQLANPIEQTHLTQTKKILSVKRVSQNPKKIDKGEICKGGAVIIN